MTRVFEALRVLFEQDANHLVAFDQESRYTVSDFQQHLSQALNELQQQPYQSYLLFANNSYHFVVNFFAILLLQKDLVLTANSKTDWLESIRGSFEAIISDSSINKDTHGNHSHCIEVTHFLTAEAPKGKLEIPDHSNSVLQFYTSGSSSQPKAIAKHFSQLMLETSNLEQLFGHSVTGCNFFATVSHHHIYGLIFRLLWPLLHKHPFHTNILLYPEELVAVSEKHSNICLISSPAFLSRHDKNLPDVVLTQCFSSGSLLSAEAAKMSHSQFKLYPVEVYGSTETGGIGYRTQANNNAVWQQFPGVRFVASEAGAMTLHSPYIQQPERLDDKIHQLTEDRFELLGRLDRVVKIEEKRVSLDAVEQALMQSPFVREAKVIVLQQTRTFIGAVIELSEEGLSYLQLHSKRSLNLQLKESLISTFEAVAIPRKWRYFERLPYNSQGKLPTDTLISLF
ncbi:AMP-binding protein [Kangiella japonica]|uniref:AMP-binding protein n=1 Tax=Kangiella japonica TaxID=647384 RepID=A0ABN0T0Q0_9GAMM